MLKQKARAISTHTKKMERLFHLADSSGDGLLDIEEFTSIVADPAVKKWLSAMELDVSDSRTLFHLIDTDGDVRLTAKELVHGAARLKGTARSIDVLTLAREHQQSLAAIREIHAKLEDLCQLRAPPAPAHRGDPGGEAQLPPELVTATVGGVDGALP